MPRKRRMRRPRSNRKFANRVKQVLYKDKESKSTQVVAFSATAITSTTSYLCNDIDTGDTKATRDGEQIYTRSLGGRFTIGHNSASALNAAVCRVVLYRPRQLDNLASSLAYTDYIDPSEQIVLYDKTFTVSTSDPVKVVNLGYKFYNNKIPNGLKTTYSSGTGTDIEQGPVYLAICSDQGTNGPLLNGYVRCFFKDK